MGWWASLAGGSINSFTVVVESGSKSEKRKRVRGRVEVRKKGRVVVGKKARRREEERKRGSVSQMF